MTNRERLAQLSDDDLADWLCKQMWDDYGTPKSIYSVDMMRIHAIRNFLKMEYKEESKDDSSTD